MDRRRAQQLARAVFATAFYVALVVAGWGFVSLLSDTDVVADRSVGPIVIPVAVGMSALAVLLLLAVPSAPTIETASFGGTVLRALVAGLVAVAVFLATGGVIIVFATGRFAEFLLFLGAQAPTFFALVIVAAGTIAALGFAFLRTREHPPRWPWEHDEEEDDRRP
jgi:hypothetical protein